MTEDHKHKALYSNALFTTSPELQSQQLPPLVWPAPAVISVADLAYLSLRERMIRDICSSNPYSFLIPEAV